MALYKEHRNGFSVQFYYTVECSFELGLKGEKELYTVLAEDLGMLLIYKPESHYIPSGKL